MPKAKKTTGELISGLKDEPKILIGGAILDGLKGGRFTFRNPLATEGGDYNQGDGGYTQSGGGNHNQGGGDYNQSSLTNNLGNLDITDLSEIMGSIKNFNR
ncbi:hypothetical protein Q4583_05375 [Neptunomonas phycophila]|uniref:hypothetical protein n=1 Tax=Neptunomonas phycophila TaxID=1572645 RepID=UPI0026E41470|nr:hypothetical protein [Neptunomonas phycophila]MDO6783537.1 hypothetical protein [Neptunomonas phycophila]